MDEKQKKHTESKQQQHTTAKTKEKTNEKSAVLDITTESEYQSLKEAYEKIEQKCNNALSLAREYKADMERMKERAKTIEEEKMKKVTENLVIKLLPVLDNLSIASDNLIDLQIKKGFLLILEQFTQILAEMGVEQIREIGEFDPNIHEAISTIPGEKSNTIAQVLKHGYKINDKVIRPTMVVIYK